MTQDELNKKAETIDLESQLSWLGRCRYFFHESDDAPFLEAIHRSLKKLKVLSDADLNEKTALKKPSSSKVRKYAEFEDAYTTFVQYHSQIGAIIRPADRNALARIVKYLTEQSKINDEAGALAAWQYILNNWTKLSPWLQKQISITSIDKHILEILTTLRNGSKKADASRKTEDNIKQRINAQRGGR